MKKQKNITGNEITFFRRCPSSGCRAISGFCLSIQEIKKDNKYFCQDCKKEIKLSKWSVSTEKFMLGQIEIRKGKGRFIGDICDYLKFPSVIEKKAISIIKEVEEKISIEKEQVAPYMAGAIYISALMNDHKQTQKKIAKLTEVSQSNLRKYYKKIIEVIGEDKLLEMVEK